jgi:hypothetical protein
MLEVDAFGRPRSRLFLALHRSTTLRNICEKALVTSEFSLIETSLLLPIALERANLLVVSGSLFFKLCAKLFRGRVELSPVLPRLFLQLFESDLFLSPLSPYLLLFLVFRRDGRRYTYLLVLQTNET